MCRKLSQSIREFLLDESGPTAVEYAVMLALIIGVCIGTIRAFGDAQNGLWGKCHTELKNHGF